MRSAQFWCVMGPSMLACAAACELWAAFVHRTLWHGPLWFLHKSHHTGPADIAPTTPERRRYFEGNDVFAIIHTALAAGLIVLGVKMPNAIGGGLCVGLGGGLTLYGSAYLLIHDGIVHRRLFKLSLRRGYLRRIRGAHLAHHRTGGAPYGLLLGPFEKREKKPPSGPPASDTVVKLWRDAPISTTYNHSTMPTNLFATSLHKRAESLSSSRLTPSAERSQ